MIIDSKTRLEELPIPEDVRPTRLWHGQLLELAAHIGPYAALLLCDKLGGQEIYVPIDASRNRISAIIGAEKAGVMSAVYGRCRFNVPVARNALTEARRGPILAAVRAGTLTINQAVAILRCTRNMVSRLVNHSDEGLEARAWVALPAPKHDARQLDMFETGAADG